MCLTTCVRSHPTPFAGCLAYLQVCIRILQGIACIRASDGSLRLAADLSLRCYSDFPATAFFNFLFLFVYAIGFPVLCVYLVYRGTHKTARSGSATSTPSQSVGNADEGSTPRESTATEPDESSASNGAAKTKPGAMSRQSTAHVVHERLHDEKRSSKYGFLYRDLKVCACVCVLHCLLRVHVCVHVFALFVVYVFALFVDNLRLCVRMFFGFVC